MHYRSIVQAAAATAALYLSAFYIPILGQALALFTPVPIIILYVRNGKREGLAALGIAAAVVAVTGWQIAVILLVTFGLMAVGTAEGMRRRWKAESAILTGGLLPIAVAALVAVYYFGHAGKNPVTAMETYLRGGFADASRLYAELGMKEMAASVDSLSEKFVHYVVRLIPGIVIATSLLQAACCYGLSRSIVARRPGSGPVLPATPLAAWHAPDVWVWGLIATLILVMVPHGSAKLLGWNLALVYSVVYLAQGIAIVEHYLRKARIQPIVRGLIHAIILALPIVVCVMALGVVDIWADFRKVRVPLKPA